MGQNLSSILCSLQVEPYNWDGTLSRPAQTVLSHHAVQVNLTLLQQAIM